MRSLQKSGVLWDIRSLNHIIGQLEHLQKASSATDSYELGVAKSILIKQQDILEGIIK